MSNVTTTSTTERRRFLPLVWLSAALAAVLLALGVNGTLATWTQAIMTNGQNAAGSASTVILTESGKDGTGADVACETSAGGVDNEISCDVINKYGSNGELVDNLEPGQSITSTITLSNTGVGAGQLDIAPGACAATYKDGGAAVAAPQANLCDVLTVAVKCVGGSTLDIGPVTLTAFASADKGFTGALAANTATDCTFTVALPGTATPEVGGQHVVQPIVWTLVAA